MTKPGKRGGKRHGRVTGGFLAVIIFKILKGLAFIVLGIAALKLSRFSEMPTAVQIARFLSVSRENDLVQRVAGIIQTVTPRQATAAGIASLVIAVVFILEGILLALRVPWSTYLTIGLTALGIPLEIYEIFHRPDSVRRYFLLAVNLGILIFLWTRRNEFREQRKAPARKAAVG
ncbi:MAG: DUF2127 domain-containing protein [Acidobacteria bacterium]|nr:DUF2127 domain-containing protein [Acidobacteriota bacterium]MCA1609902.1 DUF2127 domain-containing protein [Acidobacteriota bacterium]